MVIARRNLPTCRIVARLVVIDRETAASLARKAGDRQTDGQGRKHHVTGRRRGFVVAESANIAAYVVTRILLVPLSGQASGEFQLSWLEVRQNRRESSEANGREVERWQISTACPS
jgi:hypothetical protein